MTKNIVMDVKNISIIDDPFAIAFNFKIRNEINKYENRTFSNDQHSQF